MKIVSIDPSIQDVGWACISGMKRDEDGVWDDSESDWSWGHWKIQGNSLSYRLREIVEYAILSFDGIGEDDILVMEWPAYFGSERGQIAAQQGNTLGLAAVCGYVSGFFRLPPQSFEFVTANWWKGNLSKEITRKRFFRALGIKQIYTVNHNAVDAVMLLLEFAKRRRITFRIISKTALPYEEAAE